MIASKTVARTEVGASRGAVALCYSVPGGLRLLASLEQAWAKNLSSVGLLYEGTAEMDVPHQGRR